MSKKDIFGDDVSENKTDFADLFEQSLGRAGRQFQVGDSFVAEILSIGQEEAFLSTGGSQDAVILKSDLLDENKTLKYKVGDSIEVSVIRVRDGEIRVTRKGSRKAATDIDSLQDAFDMELPIEGRVVEAIKGGFRIEIHGRRAFCPISQIEMGFVQSGEDFVGKKYEFLITQLDESGRNIVVSRRKLLELQKAESEGAWMQTHQVGDIVPGVVTRLESFGAFVKVEGEVEGLVHISEIGFVRIKHPSESLAIGDHVQVKILKIEEQDTRLKISLSVKQAGGLGDPWLQVPQQFPVGAIVDGTVEKKENFGIFVNIAPGVSGLLPRSMWRDSVDAAQYESKKRGDSIKVRVDQIAFEDRKLTFGLPSDVEDESWKSHAQGSHQLGTLAAAFEKAKVNKS